MKEKWFALTILLGIVAVWAAGCGTEQAVNVDQVLAKEKEYVGSDTCKMCHLEHYDSWKMTQHSRMIQDAQKNKDVIISDKLKVPAEEIYVPSVDEILYTIGSQWKQRFIVRKDGTLYISPIQYNVETHRWVNYHEADWNERPWLLKCGGCHTTGVDLEAQTFKEPGVACEACHGRGSWHAALPKTASIRQSFQLASPSRSAAPATTGARQPKCKVPAGRSATSRARRSKPTTSPPPMPAATKNTCTRMNFQKGTTSSTSTGRSRPIPEKGSPAPHVITCTRSVSLRPVPKPRPRVLPNAPNAIR